MSLRFAGIPCALSRKWGRNRRIPNWAGRMKTARLPLVVVFFVLVSVCSADPRPKLSKQEVIEANKILSGTLYLRIDLPCRYYHRSGWVPGGGTLFVYVEPVVEVSTTAANVGLGVPTLSAKFLSKGVSWVFRPNDAVRFGKMYEENNVIGVDLEGVPPKKDEVVVNFVNIRNLEDFKAAFERTFSRVPLQEEHPEWPAEIRKAIAERRLAEGMTPEQAYCVVGRPLEVTTSQEDGKNLDIWYPRQQIGTTPQAIKKGATGFPKQLKFIDGRLVQIGSPDPAVRGSS